MANIIADKPDSTMPRHPSPGGHIAVLNQRYRIGSTTTLSTPCFERHVACHFVPRYDRARPVSGARAVLGAALPYHSGSGVSAFPKKFLCLAICERFFHLHGAEHLGGPTFFFL